MDSIPDDSLAASAQGSQWLCRYEALASVLEAPAFLGALESLCSKDATHFLMGKAGREKQREHMGHSRHNTGISVDHIVSERKQSSPEGRFPKRQGRWEV